MSILASHMDDYYQITSTRIRVFTGKFSVNIDLKNYRIIQKNQLYPNYHEFRQISPTTQSILHPRIFIRSRSTIPPPP